MDEKEKQFLQDVLKQFKRKYIQYLSNKSLVTMVEYIEIESKLRKTRYIIEYSEFDIYLIDKRTRKTVYEYNCKEDYDKYINNQNKTF